MLNVCGAKSYRCQRGYSPRTDIWLYKKVAWLLFIMYVDIKSLMNVVLSSELEIRIDARMKKNKKRRKSR